MKKKFQVLMILSFLLLTSCGSKEEEWYGMTSDEIEEFFGSVPEYPTLGFSGSDDYKGFAQDTSVPSEDFMDACEDKIYDSEGYGVQFNYSSYMLDGVRINKDYCIGFVSNASFYTDQYAIEELREVEFTNTRRFYILYYDRDTKKEITFNVMEFLDLEIPDYEIARYSQTINHNFVKDYVRTGQLSPIKVVEIDGRRYLQILLVNKEEAIEMRRNESKNYYVEGDDNESVVPIEKVYTTYYDLENGDYFMEDAVVYKYMDEKLEEGEVRQTGFAEDNLMYASLATTNLGALNAINYTTFDISEKAKPQCDIRFEDEFNYKCSDLSDYKIVGGDTYNIVQRLTGESRSGSLIIGNMGFLDYLKEDNPNHYKDLEDGIIKNYAFDELIYVENSLPFDQALRVLRDKDLDIDYQRWMIFREFSIDGESHDLESWEDYYKWVKPEYLPKEEDRFYGE